MGLRIDQVAAALQAEFRGDGAVTIRGAAEPALAGPEDLAVATSPDWAEGLARGRARAAILWPGADWQALGLRAAILAPRGRLAMARLTQMLDPGPDFPAGVHALALVSGELGVDVAVGPFTLVAAGARIGAGCRIGPQVSIAAGARVGAGCVLHAGVRIGPRVTLGEGCILHPGAVIGADGFSFVTAEPSRAEGARASLGRTAAPAPADATWHRIHSLGGVEIGDAVEIGANTTVDAGTLRPTRIGRGTKIDNLCQIGHNVVLGQDCLLAAQAAVAGSTRVGDRVVMGGKCGVADGLVIGDDVVLGGGSIVLSNVPPGRIMQGYPAMPMAAHVDAYKALRRLPRILRRLAGDKNVSNDAETD